MTFVPDFRTIGLPTNLFVVESGTLELESRQTSSDSVFTSNVLAAGLQEQFWSCKIATSIMERATWQEWKSFMWRLKGRVVLFEVPALAQDLPLGAGGGFTEGNAAYPITGVSLTGVSLLTGATTGLISEAAPRHAEAVLIDFGVDQADTVVLRHGDVFGLGGNLYGCTANVTADEDGLARVPFRAALWKGAQAGDVVNFRKPTFRAQLRNTNDGSVNLTPPDFGQASFTAVEVPYIQ